MGWEEMRDWDRHLYIIDTTYKIDNRWEHTVEHRELYLIRCGNLNGREVQKGGNICMCMADSFCCAVQANATL